MKKNTTQPGFFFGSHQRDKANDQQKIIHFRTD